MTFCRFFPYYWSSTCLNKALQSVKSLSVLAQTSHHTASHLPPFHTHCYTDSVPQIPSLIIPKTSVRLASPELLLHQKDSTASVVLASLKLHEKSLVMRGI